MPKIEVIEEHSSWWSEECNTALLAGNQPLLKANSKNIIEEEIRELQADIDFLRSIKDIEYKQTWMLYTMQTRKYLKNNLQKKPSMGLDKGPQTEALGGKVEAKVYPVILAKMDILLDETRREAKAITSGNNPIVEGYVRKILKQTLDRLNRIDTEMREKDYTFDGVDTFDTYMEKVETLKNYIAQLKGCIEQ